LIPLGGVMVWIEICNPYSLNILGYKYVDNAAQDWYWDLVEKKESTGDVPLGDVIN
jgi:hypothetical protein